MKHSGPLISINILIEGVYYMAFEGVAQFLAAATTGAVVDMYRRDQLLQVSFFIGIAANVVTFLSSYHQANSQLWWWLLVAVAPVLWGIFDGIGLTTSLALFADSIPDGQRSHYFTLQTVATTGGGQILGPIGALIIFAVLGDKWTVADCSKVICVAQFLLIPAYALLWCFSDDDKLEMVENVEDRDEVSKDQEQENLLEQGGQSITRQRKCTCISPAGKINRKYNNNILLWNYFFKRSFHCDLRRHLRYHLRVGPGHVVSILCSLSTSQFTAASSSSATLGRHNVYHRFYTVVSRPTIGGSLWTMSCCYCFEIDWGGLAGVDDCGACLSQRLQQILPLYGIRNAKFIFRIDASLDQKSGYGSRA